MLRVEHYIRCLQSGGILPNTPFTVEQQSGGWVRASVNDGLRISASCKATDFPSWLNAGILSGAALTHDINSWNKIPGHCGNTGHLFLAMDISKMMAVEYFTNSVETMIGQFKSAKKAEGVEEIFFPGEREQRRAAQAGENVYLLPSTWEKLELAAQYTGITL